jgi:hypothetical protein
MRSVFRRWSAGMHRSIGHLAPAPLLSAPAALRAWAGGAIFTEKLIASVSPASGEAQLSGRGDCANTISIFPSSISVRFRLLRESSDRICRPSPRTLHRSGLHRCDYVLPQKPGYSIQVRPERLEQFVYPTAKYGETCRETLFICVDVLPTSHAVSASAYRRNYRRETYT